MNREYHKWFSPALGRDMELLRFGHAGPRVLVFPSRKKRFFEYEEHRMIHALRDRLEAGALQLVCVDGIDEESLYCFDITPEQRIARHLQYERYVLDEVLPFSEQANPGTPLTAHGCSFGAYHAMTIALRHPGRFQRVLALSGRYDLTLHSGEFHSLFHGYSDPSLDGIMPSRFVPAWKGESQLRPIRKLKLTLVIGEEDPFYQNNVELSRAFTGKRIKHELHSWSDDVHRFRYWRQMVRIYL